MTLKEARKAYDRIAEAVQEQDDEAAHGRCDDLWRGVLLHVSRGGRNGRALAALALKADELPFARWCA